MTSGVGFTITQYLQYIFLSSNTVLPDYRGHFFFKFFTNAFVLACTVGTIGDVKLKVAYMYIPINL